MLVSLEEIRFMIGKLSLFGSGTDDEAMVVLFFGPRKLVHQIELIVGEEGQNGGLFSSTKSN